MATTQSSFEVDAENRDREAMRQRLQREFHISALFVPVKTVSSVLGLSSSTIYAYIRTGTFFLPYRLINKTPMVAVDDLVDWCLRGTVEERPGRAHNAQGIDTVEGSARCSAETATPAAQIAPLSPVERAVAETMSQLGLMERAPTRRRQ